MVAAIVSMFMPNYYRSEARILPADSKGVGGLGQLAQAAAAFGVGLPSQDSGDANFVDILNSRSIREDLLRAEYQFRVKRWKFGPETEHKETLYDYLDFPNMDRAIKEVGTLVVAFRDPKTKVISLTAETKSPSLSQQIVQRAVRDLGAFVMEKGRTRGGEKARFAEARLNDSKEEALKAEDAFRKFLEVNRSYQVSADPTVRLLGTRLEATLKLRQQLVMTLALNLEQALLEEKNDVPIVNVMDDPNLPEEKSRPKRSVIVLLAFFGGTAAAWAWLNREWLRTRLLANEEPTVVGPLSTKESL